MLFSHAQKRGEETSPGEQGQIRNRNDQRDSKMKEEKTEKASPSHAVSISQPAFVASNHAIGSRMGAHCQTTPAPGSNQVTVVAFALNLEPETCERLH